MKPTPFSRARSFVSLGLLCGLATADDLQLPDPLADASGKPAESAEAWEREVRPLTLEKFRAHVYGRNPVGKPDDLKWTRQVLDVAGMKEQVIEGHVTFSGPGGAGKIRVLLVIPAAAKEPVPLFLLINNRGPELSDLTKPNGFWPALEIARRGFATAMASFQSRSSGPIAAMHAGRCRTMTRSGACVAREIAASMSGLYSTMCFGSIPHEAVTTTFGMASSIRAASSWGANPPNTTECTAPIRAQASIATAASGIIGR